MIVDLGYYVLFGAVLLAAWAGGAFLLGGVLRSERWTRSGVRAILLTTAATGLASAALLWALLSHDFSVKYVHQVTELALPTPYVVTAFWAGMDGSMLMWLLFLCVYATAALLSRGEQDRPLVPWMGLAFAVVMIFFAAVVAFETNPLARFDVAPADGRGMNPALQNYWMAIHPPTLYLGYVGLTVPFAFAIGALASGRLGDGWIRSMRRWVLWPWLCLGVGMIFGGHWAYVELGWGGYWAWDPVENASLMPWLALTAFLHSVMVQERRGMFKAWNVLLVLTAFTLSVFGTFITRSGIVESVHSFAQSGIGPLFLGFVVAIVAVSAGLAYWRWPLLRSVHRIDSLASREFGFMLNNLVFMSICGVTLFLTMYPAISEWATGERWTVGASAFNEINGTMGVLLLALTGIGPVIAWRRASLRSLRRSFAAPIAFGAVVGITLFALGARKPLPLATWSIAAFVAWCILAEFVRGARVLAVNRQVAWPVGLALLVGRNRRRYGGYLVHLAVVMFFIGAAGMAYREETEAVMQPGDSVSLHGFQVRHAGSVDLDVARAEVDAVALDVTRDGAPVAQLVPQFRLHHKFPEPEKEVAVHQTAAGDLYAILAQPTDPTTGEAKVQILWNPLVAWIWWASYVLITGTVACMWPDRRKTVGAVALAAEAA